MIAVLELISGAATPLQALRLDKAAASALRSADLRPSAALTQRCGSWLSSICSVCRMATCTPSSATCRCYR